jgi:hypothetical protein
MMDAVSRHPDSAQRASGGQHGRVGPDDEERRARNLLLRESFREVVSGESPDLSCGSEAAAAAVFVLFQEGAVVGVLGTADRPEQVYAPLLVVG